MAATIAIATPAFAQIPDPTKNLPTVPVPTVQVPVPTVQVPVPTVQVPVPTVQVPVPVPTVQVPIPVPKVPVPTAPPTGGGGGGTGGGGSGASGGAGGSGGGSGGSGGAADSSGGGSSSGGTGAGSGSGGGSSSGGSGSSSAATGSGATKSASGSGAKSSSARPSSRIAPAVPTLDEGDLRRTGPVKRERRLRETVARATGCLDDLSQGQRRVLRLRAGVGEGPARSRTNVAKRLDISVRRVARLETTGLRRLRTLANRGACATVAPSTVTAAAVTTSTDPFATESAPTGRPADKGSGRASGGGESDRPAAGGVDAPAPGSDGGVRGATQSNRVPTASKAGGLDLTLPLILLLVAGLTFAVGRAAKRELAAPVAEPEPEPAAAAGSQPELGRPPPGLRRLIACKTARFALARAVQP